MKKSLLPIVLLALAAACQRAKTPEERGKAAMTGYGCMSCHQIGSKGSNVGPDLTYTGFRRSKEWLDVWLKDPKAWKHDTAMLNPHLPESVRQDIVAYLASLKGELYREGTAPWDLNGLKENPVKRGEVLFNRLGCIGCHGEKGAGGYPNNNVVGGKIPSLAAVADGYSEEELKDKIAKGVTQPEMADPSQPPPLIHMPAWGQTLKPDELDALVAYLYSLKPASSSDSW